MLRWLPRQPTDSWGTPPSPAGVYQHPARPEATPLQAESAIFVGFRDATAELRPVPSFLMFRCRRNPERLVNRPFTLTLQRMAKSVS